VYPGWYQGRITHIHFQVFVDDQLVTTSQFAFPEDVTTAVYDSELYADKGQNTSVSGFDDDGVFRDGTDSQMLELTGDTASGYNAQITVSVSA
jgi:protocatechuate 3,4-dioxygenase beta subunit